MDLYEEFVYNRTKALYTNQIAKVNECVTATLYPLYYQYEKDHDNDNDHHSDNAAHLGLLGILIWLF